MNDLPRTVATIRRIATGVFCGCFSIVCFTVLDNTPMGWAVAVVGSLSFGMAIAAVAEATS